MTIYFSDVFRSLRQEKGITQEQAAERFRVSPQAVSRWECGTTMPDIALLPDIADYLEQDRKLGDNYQYKSPLLRRTTYEKRGDTADDRTQAEIILEELLTNAGYDEIRNEREFVEAVDKIKGVKMRQVKAEKIG